MLGREGPRGLGIRNITLIGSVLAGYVFGSTAWGQFVEAPPGVRMFFTIVFVLLGSGLVWFVYLVVRLLSRLLRRGRGS